jgi:hypothetical protein
VVPAENKVTFGSLFWPTKIAQFLAGIIFGSYCPQFWVAIFVDAANI